MASTASTFVTTSLKPRPAVKENPVPTILNPYLGFRDTAREAMTFYQSVFGGDLQLSTFGDFHASEDPAEADKIMHHGLLGGEQHFHIAERGRRS
jgi:uncharacterized glyoxalase superfamily protein PhnB